MTKAKVFFTDFRVRGNRNLRYKLNCIICKAGKTDTNEYEMIGV